MLNQPALAPDFAGADDFQQPCPVLHVVGTGHDRVVKVINQSAAIDKLAQTSRIVERVPSKTFASASR
jgi:hypothetical protein